jgi:hypothetical protein
MRAARIADADRLRLSWTASNEFVDIMKKPYYYASRYIDTRYSE